MSELRDAISNNNINEIIRQLEAGADPNISVTGAGTTPLMMASRRGFENIVRLLIDAGADVNITDRYGRNALEGTTNENIFRLLIESGSNIDNINIEGLTILMTSSIYCDDLNKVKILLEYGANINITNHDNQTALDIARQNYNDKIHMDINEGLRPGYRICLESIIELLERAENAQKTLITLDSFIKSEDKYDPSNSGTLVSEFYTVKDSQKMMKKILSYIDKYNKEAEGAEETKNRDGGRRKSTKRKRKSSKRKSTKRKRKSSKRKSSKRK
jgi:hypothetical protein